MCPNYQEFLSDKSTTLRVHSETSATSNLPEVILCPKVPFIQKSHSISPRFLHYRVFSTSRFFPSWRSQLWTWSSNKRSSMVSADTYATLFSPTFITCNASINAGNYRQWQISQHAIPLTSVNDHDHYNKFNTCRSCCYNGPTIRLHASIQSSIYDPSSLRRSEVLP